jgi:hypothetical protein
MLPNPKSADFTEATVVDGQTRIFKRTQEFHGKPLRKMTGGYFSVSSSTPARQVAGAPRPHSAEVFAARSFHCARPFRGFWRASTRFNRWLNSDFRLRASAEVRAFGLDLFFIAQNQSPVGTLPTNEAVIAKLLMIDLAHWRELCKREITPLYNWTPCRCGAKVRLMHPVVTEQAQDAIARREAREASNSQKAVYQRLRRLREALGDLGCSREVLNDDLLIERMDGWLLQHCSGRRTAGAYGRALTHAIADGWLANGGNSRK